MKALERVRLVDQIGAHLQATMTTTDINHYLKEHGVSFLWEKVADSKRVYVKNALNHAPAEIVFTIAQELGLAPPVAHALTMDLSQLLSRHGAAKADLDAAVEKIGSDPATAIGMAATTLESVCKAILDAKITPYPADETLRSLMKGTLPLLNLSPDQHADDDIKKTLAGLLSTADGLASLRNKYSTFHGKGQKQLRLTARHARLAVSAMATLAYFLIETFHTQDASGARSGNADK